MLGLTFRFPGVGIPPIPLSMVAEVACVTAPQLSVVELPVVIVLGDALNDEITGGGHGVTEGPVVGVLVEVGEGVVVFVGVAVLV